MKTIAEIQKETAALITKILATKGKPSKDSLKALQQLLKSQTELQANPKVSYTPSSRWAQKGQPDPHAGFYDVERAQLPMGKLTDDELANAAFMNYDQFPPIQAVIDGKAYMPITYMTAVKDRIRWLSRKLGESEARNKSVVTEESHL